MNALLLAIALTTSTPSPDVAQAAPCFPVGNVLNSQTVTVIDDERPKSKLVDRLLIVTKDGDEYMWFFQDGCAVAQPLYLGPEPTSVMVTPGAGV